MQSLYHLSHDLWLVFSALAVAFMAGFTALNLLNGASRQDALTRKKNVAMAAIAMGGGIWSMHFVAMLGVRLELEVFFEPVTTVLSAMLAILVVGVGLLLVHFGDRSRAKIIGAGALVGVGVLIMHYVGMSAMRGAIPIYSPFGVGVAIVFSVALNIVVFHLAYGERSRQGIILGTVVFGASVFAVHFVAMMGTQFKADLGDVPQDLLLSNTVLGLMVSLGAFLICGAFLLVGVSFVTSAPQAKPEPAFLAEAGNKVVTLPYEKNGRTYFIEQAKVAVVRAEGHYSLIYTAEEKLFCPWSMAEFSRRTGARPFIKVHRSYLINPDFIASFERTKDNGICYLKSVSSIEKVPVSRSCVSLVRAALGLE